MAFDASKTEPTITRALRVEIVKPLSHSWDDAGTVLRDLRTVAHRLYTAAALEAIEADKAKLRATRSGSKVAGLVHPQTAAYRAVEEELSEIREWAAGKVAKAKKPEPKLERLSELLVPGGTKAAISASAFVHFQKWRKDKGNNRVPTWKHGAPIPVRAQESSLEMDGDRVVLTVKLVGGRGSKPFRFAVRAGRSSHWQRVRDLASGKEGLKRGEAKLSYSVREKKWHAFIAYSEPAPKPSKMSKNNVLVLHRGQHNLLVGMTSTGHWKVIATGHKLREFKRRMKARREQVQSRGYAERGNGSRGHGRKRRYALPDRLSETERNYVHTLCQQIGARVVELATQYGCGRVAIEEYGGIKPDSDRGKRMYLERFPNHELKQCIAWSLKKAGIELVEYPAEYVSQICPACGDVARENADRRKQVFHCGSCKFERPLDFVSAIHALRRTNDKGKAGVWEGRLAAVAKLAAKLRKDDNDKEEE